MRRRDFVTMLGGAAAVSSVSWPLAARAQQPRMRRVGYLVGYPETDATAQARNAAFRRGLQELGWIEGRNVRIDPRFAGTDPARIETDAADLVGLAPDVIFASPAQVALALRKLTNSIPIVFANVPDAVGVGLVQSLAHPGGNVTGFTTYEPALAGKWVEVLKEMAPRVARIAVAYSPANPAWPSRLHVIESVAPAVSVKITPVPLHSDADILHALAAFADEPDGGLIVLPSIFMTTHRRTIIEAAGRHRLPAIYPFRYYAVEGGLLAYGIDGYDQFKQAAAYVDRILKGAKPADLPVQAPTKYELVINLKTAKALGLDIPPMLLARADEVIE
jgi:putative ABC transport system substrate-binding protein